VGRKALRQMKANNQIGQEHGVHPAKGARSRLLQPLAGDGGPSFGLYVAAMRAVCGKTALRKEGSLEWKVLDLEKLADFDAATRDPDLFLGLDPRRIIIDQCPLLPAMVPTLRVAVDSSRDQAGRFVIPVRVRPRGSAPCRKAWPAYRANRNGAAFAGRGR
jgi:hypothetical protein